MRPVDAHRLAEVDDLLGPGLNGIVILRLQRLEKDIHSGRASREGLALSEPRPITLAGEVTAGGSPNHLSHIKNKAKAAVCTPSLARHDSQIRSHFRIGNHIPY
jgi:hypothetical protein